MDKRSGVGVLDKVVGILDALSTGPVPLAALVRATGLPRATSYRLASALAVHELVRVDAAGRFALGPHLAVLAAQVAEEPLVQRATPVLERLQRVTGESAQLYQRRGRERACLVAVDPPSGLRDSVPAGALLPMTAGSAAQVLLAWEPPVEVADLVGDAAFTEQTLALVRRRGWAASVAEREPGVASVSAPVRAADGRVVAAISVSGPLERMTRSPGRRFAAAVVAAAAELHGGPGANPGC